MVVSCLRKLYRVKKGENATFKAVSVCGGLVQDRNCPRQPPAIRRRKNGLFCREEEIANTCICVTMGILRQSPPEITLHWDNCGETSYNGAGRPRRLSFEPVLRKSAISGRDVSTLRGRWTNGVKTDCPIPEKRRAPAPPPLGGVGRDKTSSPQQSERGNSPPLQARGVLEILVGVALDDSPPQAWVEESSKPDATSARAKCRTARKFAFLSNEAHLQ